MRIKHYLFCIKWLWRNRTWANTRQKFKAMERDWAAVQEKHRRKST